MLGDFGRYELLEEIGHASQGVVYRAHQKTSFVFSFFLSFPMEVAWKSLPSARWRSAL
jgi:hypothetical protein